VPFNPVKGVSRPKGETYEGKTPAISDAQVRALLDAPKGLSLKAKRDRAILSILFYHALRRDELCKLMVKDIHERRGVKHLRVTVKARNSATCRSIRGVSSALGNISQR
jgi:integrase